MISQCIHGSRFAAGRAAALIAMARQRRGSQAMRGGWQVAAPALRHARLLASAAAPGGPEKSLRVDKPRPAGSKQGSRNGDGHATYLLSAFAEELKGVIGTVRVQAVGARSIRKNTHWQVAEISRVLRYRRF